VFYVAGVIAIAFCGVFIFFKCLAAVGAMGNVKAIGAMIYIPPSLPALCAAELFGLLFGGLHDGRAAVEAVIRLDDGSLHSLLLGLCHFGFMPIAECFHSIVWNIHCGSNTGNGVPLLTEREYLLFLCFGQNNHP
jgi:hypothetical protein